MNHKIIIKILFVCLGNICRSPMAEFVMKHLVKEEGLEESFYIESAGTSNSEMGNHIYPPARQTLYLHNVSCKEIDKKVARQICKDDYDKFDYILVAEEINKVGVMRIVGEDSENKIFKILDFAENEQLKHSDIDDPWYTGDFEKTYNDILLGCKGFIMKLKKDYSF